jgi:hypothetical protein
VNLFNRVVVFLLLLLLIIGAVSIAVLTWTIPNDTIDWLRDAVEWMDENDGSTEKALLTAIAIVITLVSFILLVLELMPKSTRDVRVTDVQGGAASLSSAAVAQRIEDAVRQVPNVAEAKAYVMAKRKGVEVSMDLHVDPDANLAEVTTAAAEATREVLADRLHVALLTPPKTRLHYRELRLRRPDGPEPANRGSNTAVVPAAAAEAPQTGEVMPPRSEAAEAGWRPPASPDNTDAAPQATNETPPADKPAKPEPETENKFE